MADQIEDLMRKSIRKMTTDEIQARILEVRQERRSGGRKKKTSDIDSLMDMLDKMPAKEKAEFLKELKEDYYGKE